MKLPSSYLTKRVTEEDVAKEYSFESCHPDFRADWERLIGKKQPGDELWRFAPPTGAIEVSGVALVRDGEVVSTLVDAVG